jgi:hypothetical protein
MKIEYTSRYIKDYSDVRDQRAKKDIDKVVNVIRTTDNFVHLFRFLDIKKYDSGLGGYRIRFSNKPEWRIRFDVLDDYEDKRNKIIQLQMVLPREKYEKYAHKSINEQIEDPIKIILTESQISRLLSTLSNV